MPMVTTPAIWYYPLAYNMSGIWKEEWGSRLTCEVWECDGGVGGCNPDNPASLPSAAAGDDYIGSAELNFSDFKDDYTSMLTFKRPDLEAAAQVMLQCDVCWATWRLNPNYVNAFDGPDDEVAGVVSSPPPPPPVRRPPPPLSPPPPPPAPPVVRMSPPPPAPKPPSPSPNPIEQIENAFNDLLQPLPAPSPELYEPTLAAPPPPSLEIVLIQPIPPPEVEATEGPPVAEYPTDSLVVTEDDALDNAKSLSQGALIAIITVIAIGAVLMTTAGVWWCCIKRHWCCYSHSRGTPESTHDDLLSQKSVYNRQSLSIRVRAQRPRQVEGAMRLHGASSAIADLPEQQWRPGV